MKKKINFYMIAVAITAVLSTALLVAFVFNGVISNQVIDDLRIACRMIVSMDEFDELDKLDSENFQITWVDEEGKILFDSFEGREQEHIKKKTPEIINAFKKGAGFDVRSSDSLDEDSYFYAIKLEDGSVLRVSMDSESILGLVGSTIPFVAGLLLIMALLCFLITRVLTKKLIKPIEKIADNLSYQVEPEYDELVPVVNMLKEQHENILNNARVRQEFSANVSHELKTPLTVISGYAELIENKMVDEESVIRFAGEIHHHSNRLLSLINDIIKLSELDSESVEIEYEEFDLCEVIDDCAGIIKENASQHDISVEIDCERRCYIQGSRSMLEELVINLANNAVSYNRPGGSVKLTVKHENDTIVLSVSDTGIGISKEHMERIFERFYRVDKSRSKRSGGTGLGLAIVKHIAASHNAQIILDSEEGRGTTVKVIFNSK